MEATSELKRPRDDGGDLEGPDVGEKMRRIDAEGDAMIQQMRDPNTEIPPDMFNGDVEVDAMEGASLDVDPGLITAAKKTEWDQLKAMGTFEIVKRMPKMKVLGTRWVLTNKGGKGVPRIKARFVAKDFWQHDGAEDIFRARPICRASS